MVESYRATTRASVEQLEPFAARPATTMVERLKLLGTLDALAELRARLEWLDFAERELAQAGSGST